MWWLTAGTCLADCNGLAFDALFQRHRSRCRSRRPDGAVLWVPKTKQPYAIAMKSGDPSRSRPYGRAGGVQALEEWVRTFCIITTNANELVREIHDRMPVIPRDGYEPWLANIGPDPRDLLVPHPSELMTMWPISTRVNKPEHDDPSILEPVDPAQHQEDLLTLGRAPS